MGQAEYLRRGEQLQDLLVELIDERIEAAMEQIRDEYPALTQDEIDANTRATAEWMDLMRRGPLALREPWKPGDRGELPSQAGRVYGDPEGREDPLPPGTMVAATQENKDLIAAKLAAAQQVSDPNPPPKRSRSGVGPAAGQRRAH